MGPLPPDDRACLPSPGQTLPGAVSWRAAPDVAVHRPRSVPAPNPRETEIILKMHTVASCQDDSNQLEEETGKLVLSTDLGGTPSLNKHL